MIYLDTNVVVWLSSGNFQLISDKAIRLIQSNSRLLISPMVELELQYLFEIHRITVKSEKIVNQLQEAIGLNVCQHPFPMIIQQAKNVSWTRDPFDRMITATAMIHNSRLISSDKTIAKHYKHVIW